MSRSETPGDGDGGRGPVTSLKLDFPIPAIPNDGSYSQIALFRLALDRLGGMYREARLVAVFGDTMCAPLPPRWRPFFERTEIAWAEAAAFHRHGYLAPALKRFELFRSDAHLVVFCDADTVLMRGLTTLVAQLVLRPAVAGVIAHFHPWEHGEQAPGEDCQRFALEILGRPIALPYFYSLTAETEANRCPFSVNAGFVAAPPRLLSALSGRFAELFAEISRRFPAYFAAQLTVPLLVEDLALPTVALPMRYNFPNDRLAERKYEGEQGQIVLLHYLREIDFRRQDLFSRPEQFAAFLEKQVSGSNGSSRNSSGG